MGNALFIIWRESAEAMLVVGILYAWLARQPDRRAGMRYLWGGVAAGRSIGGSGMGLVDNSTAAMACYLRGGRKAA